MTEIWNGFTVRSVEHSTDWGVLMIIYGAAGTGKTTLAAEAHESEHGKPTLFLDAEGGVTAISHDPTIKVIEVEKWSDVQRFMNSVKSTPKGEFPWKTVVLDNLSEYQAINLKGLVAVGMPQIQDYGKSWLDLTQLVRDCRDCCIHKGINFIICVWESPEKEESTGIIKRRFSLTPALQNATPGMVEIVGRLTVASDGVTRELDFTPSNRTDAKFRRPQTSNAMQIPLKLSYTLQDKVLVDLLATLRGNAPWPKAKYERKNK